MLELGLEVMHKLHARRLGFALALDKATPPFQQISLPICPNFFLPEPRFDVSHGSSLRSLPLPFGALLITALVAFF